MPDYLLDLYEKSVEIINDYKHKKKLAEVLLKNYDAFAKNKLDLGSYSVISHKIYTTGAKPIGQQLRRTTQGFEGEEEKYLQDQIANGVVVPSKSSWASPVWLVRKKDMSVRWCIGYRRLNDSTIKDVYPLPKISVCLDCFGSGFSLFRNEPTIWILAAQNCPRRSSQDGIYYQVWPF